uniref:Delta-like protein n=1 Tax=Attheya septentrionalis TaxID=420275 RepID=A0A7S2U8S7_9STRA|mmetsp:Transcript_12804/g.23156  ORF Transcript_12804/g.23156 Transcript_12804/m.23156 type:complete len:621 (+) Transcript_12804:156-2018(+)
MLSRLALFSLFVATAMAAENTTATDGCTLSCHGNGVCQFGAADFTDATPVKDGDKVDLDMHDQTSLDNMYCDCDPGFTGLHCAHAFVSCNPDDPKGKEHNDHKCFHGSTCVLGLPDEFDNKQYYCDCTTTNHPDQKRFAGLFCEFQEVERCNDDGTKFCTREGTCKNNAEKKTHPCNCGSDLEGPHCEWDAGYMPDCDLKCENSGECAMGFKHYDDASKAVGVPWGEHKQIDLKYCVCPEGFTGLQCEVQVGDKCADDKCYHGGVCATSGEGSSAVEICDCSPAHTKKFSFSGKYCEYKSTTWCTKEETHNGKQFCTNNGTCRTEDHKGCDCPSGFTGSQCEYKSAVATPPKCNLDCENKGICRKGVKDFGVGGGSKWGLAFLNVTHLNYEHCVCPEGFTGLQCEYEVETCENGEHNCLNGGACVKVAAEGDEYKHACDCAGDADSTHHFSGFFCEHAATSICTVDDPSTSALDHVFNVHAFCTNGGTCKKKVGEKDKHAGCACPKGFEGGHCELNLAISANAPQSIALSSPSIDNSTSEDSKLSFLFALLFTCVAVLIFFVIVKRRHDADRIETSHQIASNHNLALGAILDEVESSPGPVKGFNPESFVNKVEYTTEVL